MSNDHTDIEVLISLGGNIGDPSITIEDALAYLSNQRGVKVITRSPFYKTPPWGKTDQSEFVNACARLTTTLSPQELLKTCLSVETQMGRVRGERWGPRIIDIDILTYDDEELNEKDLTLPHPHIKDRAFVLVPLRDIAPDFELDGQSIDKMLEPLSVEGIMQMELG